MAVVFAPYRYRRALVPRHLRRRPAESCRRHLFGRTLRIESLESRVLLAGDVSVTVSGGDLRVDGTNDADQLAIFVDGGDVVVQGFDGTTINGGNERIVALTGTDTIARDLDVNLLKGSDVVVIGDGLKIGNDANINMYVGDDVVGLSNVEVGHDLAIGAKSGNNTVVLSHTTVGHDVAIETDEEDDLVGFTDVAVGHDLDVRVQKGEDTVVTHDLTVRGNSNVDANGSGPDAIVVLESTFADEFTAKTGNDENFLSFSRTQVAGRFEANLARSYNTAVFADGNRFDGAFQANAGLNVDALEDDGSNTFRSAPEVNSFDVFDVEPAFIDAQVQDAQSQLSGAEALLTSFLNGDPLTSDAHRAVSPADNALVFVSSQSGGVINDVDGKVQFKDEDILVYNTETDTWAMHFDGSDSGLNGADINAFHILDDNDDTTLDPILMSVKNLTIPVIGDIDDSDIVRFTPISLGEDTAGAFSLEVRGADVGLTTNSEWIDALGLLDDGRFVVSTSDTYDVAQTGGGTLAGTDSDLIVLNPDETWELYFDGSDVGLTLNTEDVWGVWIDPGSDEIYLTTNGAFSGPGPLNGDDNDVFIFSGVTGPDTSGTFSSFFDGDAVRFNKRIDGITIALRNLAPEAMDDDFVGNEDSVVAGNVLLNDADPNGDTLTVNTTPVSATSNGALVLMANGDFTYTPNADYFGGDMFEYEIDDGNGATDTATVTITVLPVNDAPSFTAGPNQLVEENAGAQTVSAWATAISRGPSNESGQTLMFDVAVGSTTGTLSFDGLPAVDAGSGDLTFHATDGTSGSAQVNVMLMDDGATANGGVDKSATESFTITVVPFENDPPTVMPPGPFDVIGNVQISVPVGADDLLAGASDPQTPLSVGGLVPTSTANGGDIAINTADGSFTYDPPAGFEGTDSFDYQVCDAANACSNPVTVSLNVGDLIWFIDSSQGGAGDGRLSSPFSTLSAFEAANGEGGNSAPEAGDDMFLYSGDYVGGVTLEDDQRLIGQGVTNTSLADLLGIMEPTYSAALPSINGARPELAGAAVALGQSNTVRGLNIGDADGTALDGTSVGTLVVDEVGIENNLGGAVAIAGGSSVSVNIDLVSAVSGSNDGISLSSNEGTFTFGDVSITATSGAGLVAVDSGDVNVVGDENSIDSSTGNAVNITDTTIGPSGVTFESINSTGAGSNTAIILDDTGSGLFTVTGEGTTSGSGGTVSNKTVDAVTLSNTGGRITLRNFVIEDISHPNDSTDAADTRSESDALHGEQVVGGLTLDNVTIQQISDNAIHGAQFSDGLSATSWNGLEILNSTIQNTNRFHLTGTGDASDEGAVRIVGLSGTVVVDNSVLQSAGELLDIFTDTAGLLDLTVQRSQLLEAYKEFDSGGITAIGKNGIDVTVRGTSDAVIRIGDPNESDPTLGNVFRDHASASMRIAHETGATGNVDAVISQNSFSVTDHSTAQQAPGNFVFNFPQGGVSLNPGGGTYEAIISQNTFDQVMHADGGLGQLTITMDEGGESEFIVRGNSFNLPWDAPVRILADGNSESAILFDANTYGDGTVGGSTDDLGAAFPSPFNPFLVDVRNGGELDLTMQNEVLPQHDDTVPDGSGIENSFVAAVATGTLNLHITGSQSPDGYLLQQSGGTFNLFQGPSTSTDPTQIIDDNGNTGGNNNDATDPPVVVVVGTITPSAVAPALPDIVAPLMATGGQIHAHAQIESLAVSHFAPIVEAAITRWIAAGVSVDDEQLLSAVSFSVADLADGQLGGSFAGGIRIDDDAAGHGWFIDSTPGDDDEFSVMLAQEEVLAAAESDAAGRMDLLTVVMHELGHVLGLDDVALGEPTDILMSESLPPGVRRLMTEDQLRTPASGMGSGNSSVDVRPVDTAFAGIPGGGDSGPSVRAAIVRSLQNPVGVRHDLVQILQDAEKPSLVNANRSSGSATTSALEQALAELFGSG